jgi:hypothetical protein
MDYGNLKVPENVTPEVQAILDSYDARNKEIENAHRKNMFRIGLGSALSGASAHPILNVPYVGTGLGGALYELGQGITEGDKLPELAKRTGTGFAIGETVGAIPYAGKYANKLSGGKIGNAFTAGVEKLASTPLGQKVAEIAPKVEDLLMTDIKAFNPNRQTVYHGSPYDFAKFSNEAIGTGEGAQAHGMGHYAAVNKNVAEGYRQRLGGYEYDGKPVLNNSDKDILINKIINDGYNNTLSKYQKQLDVLDEAAKKWEHSPNDYNEVKRIANEVENKINIINDIDTTKIKRSSGQLYKLSIPKDDVMLREDLPLNQQPLKVQEALNQIGSYKTVTPATMYNGELYKHYPNGLFKGWFKANGGGKVNDELAEVLDNIGYTDEIVKMGNYFDEEMTGNQIYQKLNNDYHNNYTYTQGLKPSDLLNQHGIKGISYNGGMDGEARVIFNPDDIEIVRKYYNQPSLYELIKKQKPFYGGVSNALYDYITGE